jgi:hypothetical protein
VFFCVRKRGKEGKKMMAKYMRTISRKALAVIVALAMLLAMAPMGAWEASAESGEINMSNDTPAASGTNWTYASGAYTITGDVTVTGNNGGSNRHLEVLAGPEVSITLENATIDVSSHNDTSPLKLNTYANVTLTIKGTNSLTAGDDQAGINAPKDTTLSISGSALNDALTVTGGNYAAGIGGGRGESGGTITIYGGTVNATSSGYGAGIGGGYGGSGGTITISGGTVNATSGYWGAGIGGGDSGDGGTITISGGTVTATSVRSGAGIGGGTDGDGGTITISGGEITANGLHGAGIGGGDGGDGGTITISRGVVTATSVYGGDDGAGIGGGFYGSGGNITISGGTVNATSGDGAGIGGGAYESGGTITIFGDTVNATSGYMGAGIGGGLCGSGGTITISGGIVAATGGSNGGSGIGGGIYINPSATGGDIIICGEAIVTAKGGIGAGNIGGGNSGVLVNQFIAALVNNNPTESYKVVGNPTLAAGLTANIPAGQTMTVPKDSTLTVNGTIDVYGAMALGSESTIDNNGTVNIYGTLDNYGTLNNYGAITIEKGGGFTGNGAVGGNPVMYAGADVSKPAVNGEPTETMISVNPSTLLSDTGQQIEYAISTNQTEPQGGWQDRTTFAVLTPGTTYYVFARSKAYENTTENKSYATGKASVSDPIATKAADTPVAPSANATTVDKNVTSIRTPLKTIHMQRGTTLTPPVCADSKDPVTEKPHITAKLTWSSSNPKIATVNAATGKIKARKAGKAKITATALNGEKLTITVNVTKNAIALKTLTLKKAPNSLKAGKAILLSVKTTPYPATNLKITFSSSNKKILSVDKAGKLTAIKKGTAKITIKANGKKYAKAITVN